MDQGREKRRDPRVPLVLRVDYPGVDQAIRDVTENVSAGGLFIRTERDLHAGHRVPLQVSFPGLAETARNTFGRAKRTYRVLVVEDNVRVVEMYEYALRKLRSPDGVDVAIQYAPNGHEALGRLAERPRVDLVMTDLYMPVMDGFGLAERMRSDPAFIHTPIVVISAGGADARARAADLGIDVYLQKPVQFADVISTVRTLLKIRA